MVGEPILNRDLTRGDPSRTGLSMIPWNLGQPVRDLFRFYVGKVSIDDAWAYGNDNANCNGEERVLTRFVQGIDCGLVR